MNQEHKKLIERYFNGDVSSDDLAAINRLILEDEEFSERFEIRKALKEVDELENEFTLKSEFEELLQNYHNEVEKKNEVKVIETLKRRRILTFSFAGLVILLLTTNIYYFLLRDVQDFTRNVDYSEVNYNGGTGFNENGDSSKPVFVKKLNIKFLAAKNQKDTIYQIINADSLKIIFPKLTNELKKTKISILHDYKLESTLFLMNKDTFLIENSSNPQKLLKYKK